MVTKETSLKVSDSTISLPLPKTEDEEALRPNGVLMEEADLTRQIKNLLETGQEAKAVALLQLLLDSSEQTVGSLFQTAEIFFKHNHSDIAALAYQAILKLDANHIPALGRLGDIAQDHNDSRAAADLFRQIIENDPQPQDWAYIGLGNALEKLDASEEALTYLTKVSNPDPLILRIARLKQRVGLLDEAIEYFENFVLDALTDQDHKIIVDSYIYAIRYGHNRFAQRIQHVLDKIAHYRYELAVDGFSSEKEVHGWLRDKMDPGQLLALELMENGQIITVTTNNLVDEKRGPGGFTFTLPADVLDGNPHIFTLRLKDYFGYLGEWQIITPLLAGESKDPLKFAKNINNYIAVKLEEDIGFRKERQIVNMNKHFLACDRAFLFNSHTLILTGWIAKYPDQIKQIKLFAPDSIINVCLKTEVSRHLRADLLPNYPWSSSVGLGYLIVIDKSFAGNENEYLSLGVACINGQYQKIQIKPISISWAELAEFINQNQGMARPLFRQLSTKLEKQEILLLEKFKHDFYSSGFLSNYSSAQTMVERPDRAIVAIDRAYPLKQQGVLIFGWRLMPKRQPEAVYICNEDGAMVNITDNFFAVMRSDVAGAYRERFPGITNDCGFICLAPLATWPGESRALIFDFGDLGELWLKLPTEAREKEGVELIKEILSMIPAPDQIRNRLFELYASGLGKAIESIAPVKKVKDAASLTIQQFGIPPKNPRTSVIVPLYGRYDFVRYQLSHFADDADFQNIDLIYVIDDPNIIMPTQELAIVYYPVFGVPFRTVSYNSNLGFAGANNVGVSIARGDTVLLLNSDVLPKDQGWVSCLQQALDSLPDAGAVAPLLLFADESVQHAGMAPKRDPRFPGFLLNTHPGKGQPWAGTSAPYECAMLTAACVMLKRQDYLDLGGLDEGYIIGDFEDSDLCLALIKQGKRLWLAPEAKLWHLERQSQNLESIAGYRQLLTLYNGWRFQKKIRDGLIADPTKFTELEAK